MLCQMNTVHCAHKEHGVNLALFIHRVVLKLLFITLDFENEMRGRVARVREAISLREAVPRIEIGGNLTID